MPVRVAPPDGTKLVIGYEEFNAQFIPNQLRLAFALSVLGADRHSGNFPRYQGSRPFKPVEVKAILENDLTGALPSEVYLIDPASLACNVVIPAAVFQATAYVFNLMRHLAEYGYPTLHDGDCLVVKAGQGKINTVQMMDEARRAVSIDFVYHAPQPVLQPRTIKMVVLP